MEHKTVYGFGLALAVALALSGCKDGSTGRPLVKQKGVYQGAPMPDLNDATVEQARDRARATQGQI